MEREKGIIERGRIIAIKDQGYSVASLDRDGIETQPIRPIEHGQANANVPEYTVGTMVYYFVFHDGTGRIICAV